MKGEHSVYPSPSRTMQVDRKACLDEAIRYADGSVATGRAAVHEAKAKGRKVGTPPPHLKCDRLVYYSKPPYKITAH